MEKLQLGRKRKTDAEKPRMDPLMRALPQAHMESQLQGH